MKLSKLNFIEPLESLDILIENLDKTKFSIIFIDGFDKVGKTTIIDYMRDRYPHVRAYSPSWSESDSPMSLIDYGNRKYVGLSIIDLVESIGSPGVLVIDRSIMSSVVYDSLRSDLSEDKTRLDLDMSILDDHLSEGSIYDRHIKYNLKNVELYYIIVQHHSIESAMSFYVTTLGRRELCNFGSFYDYVHSYNNFIDGIGLVYKYDESIRAYVTDSLSILKEG